MTATRLAVVAAVPWLAGQAAEAVCGGRHLVDQVACGEVRMGLAAAGEVGSSGAGGAVPTAEERAGVSDGR